MKKLALTALAALILAGCSTHTDPNVSFKNSTRPGTICLVDNPQVRSQAFLAIRRALMDKGFYVQRVEAQDSRTIAECQQVLNYEAIYGSSWSQSSLRYAKLMLTERTKHNNVYTAQWDERSHKPTLFDKIDDADVELRKLVDRLFPTAIPWS